MSTRFLAFRLHPAHVLACALALVLWSLPAPPAQAQMFGRAGGGAFRGGGAFHGGGGLFHGGGGAFHGGGGGIFHSGGGAFHGGGGILHGGGGAFHGGGGFHHGGGAFFHHGYGDDDFGGVFLNFGFGGLSPYYYDYYPYDYYPYPYYYPPADYPAYPPVAVLPDSGGRGSQNWNNAPGDDDDYYLNRGLSPLVHQPGLADAVGDIEAAFRSKDVSLLAKHVDPSSDITVVAAGNKQRTMKGSDYLALTRTAFDDMDTVSFSLPRVAKGADGAWTVRGTHIVHRTKGNETFNVGFVLQKHGDRWVITEVTAHRAP